MRLLLLSLAVAAVGAQYIGSNAFLRFLAAKRLFLVGEKRTPIPILRLPNQTVPMDGKQFSGYLKASATRYLHYYFSYPTDDYAKLPLIVWLQGGPGCSPLVGAFTEIGPFNVQKDGTLKKNHFSWNRIANQLFINAPVGTGFSYATDGNLKNNDTQVAEENYAAISDFFEQFPKFFDNELYLMGQSYAAIDLTLLAEKLRFDKNREWNIKGVLVGNGLFAWHLFWGLTPIKAYNLKSHGHGRFFSEDKLKKFGKECCGGSAYNGCDVSQSEKKFDCAKATTSAMLADFAQKGRNRYNVDHGCEDRERSKTLAPIYPCIDNSAVYNYLNREDVRKVFGIPKNLPNWEVCNVDVWLAYKTNRADDMGPQVKKLLDGGVRFLLYYGERDLQTNDLVGREFCRRLGLEKLGKDKALIYDRKVAGDWITYKSNNHSVWEEAQHLYLVTIKNAGFFVPSDQPELAFRLVDAFTRKDHKVALGLLQGVHKPVF